MAKMMHPMLYDPRAGTWAELKSDTIPTPRHNFAATMLQVRGLCWQAGAPCCLVPALHAQRAMLPCAGGNPAIQPCNPLQDKVYVFGGTKSETTVSSPSSARKEATTKVRVGPSSFTT
jgi:hypothetical protein